MIDSREAVAALDDIKLIAQRVRQSRVYQIASLLMILWGVLTFAGYLVSFLWPRYAGLTWIAVDVVGFAGSFAIGVMQKARAWRIGVAFVLLLAFGLLWVVGIAHFTPRQLSAFWPTYYMLGYSIAGLWLGPAFLVIGLTITALTLVGYFFAGPWFDLWMAFVNGGGLLLAGAWMRRD